VRLCFYLAHCAPLFFVSDHLFSPDPKRRESISTIRPEASIRIWIHLQIRLVRSLAPSQIPQVPGRGRVQCMEWKLWRWLSCLAKSSAGFSTPCLMGMAALPKKCVLLFKQLHAGSKARRSKQLVFIPSIVKDAENHEKHRRIHRSKRESRTSRGVSTQSRNPHSNAQTTAQRTRLSSLSILSECRC
jgi:hypothetical protein